MEQLPHQRGFYDDVRGFQRKDIKVRLEGFAPTPKEQRRTQLLAGVGIFAFVLGAFALSQCLAQAERTEKPEATSLWQGVSGWVPPGAIPPPKPKVKKGVKRKAAAKTAAPKSHP